MAEQSINAVLKIVDSMQESFKDLRASANDLLLAGMSFGGEISRVLQEQLNNYLIPALKNLSEDVNTPGSIIGLDNFLRSVPVSFTVTDPTEDSTPAGTTPAPNVNPDTYQVSQPASDTMEGTFDNLPQGASFQTPAGAQADDTLAAAAAPVQNLNADIEDENTPVMEAAIKKEDVIREASKFLVVRTSGLGSALGDIAKLEDSIVAEFDKEEDAACKAKELNETVMPAEKELLGTNYAVVEKKDEPEDK